MTTSPPQPHNFDVIPTIGALDEFFHRKYADVGSVATETLRKVATAEQVLAAEQARPAGPIHLPSPSYWHALSLTLPVIGFGIIYNTLLALVGAVLAIVATFGWALEPSVEPEQSRPTITPGSASVRPIGVLTSSTTSTPRYVHCVQPRDPMIPGVLANIPVRRRRSARRP